MNYKPAQFIPSIADLPYSSCSSMSKWVNKIASTLWNEMLKAPQHLNHFQSCEPGYVPQSWKLPGGWSKYDRQGDQWEQCDWVELPKCMALDIESQRESPDGHWRPVLAIAMSATTWYAWRWDGIGLPETIPFPSGRIVVGHNVRAYDARYLSCEYDLNTERTLFIDTMDLARAWMGMDASQIPLYKQLDSNVRRSKGAPQWYNHATMLSLKDLAYEILGKTIDKSVRSSLERWDMSGMVEHVRSKLPLSIQQKLDKNILTYGELVAEASQLLATFQDLSPTSLGQYCAQDVHTTYQVFQYLWGLSTKQLIPDLVSWVGLHEISNMRCITESPEKMRHLDEEFIRITKGEVEHQLAMIAFDAKQDDYPELDWTEYKSGPNKGELKWLTQLKKDGWSTNSRTVIQLLRLTWKGHLIEWKNRQWCANGEPLLNSSGKPLTSTPIQRLYKQHVFSGCLKSLAMNTDAFQKFFCNGLSANFKALDYNDAYILQPIPGVYMSVAGVHSMGCLHHGPSGYQLSTDSMPGCEKVFTSPGRFLNSCGAHFDVIVAQWLASSVSGSKTKISGIPLEVQHLLVRGLDRDELKAVPIALADEIYQKYNEFNSQIEASLNYFAHQSHTRSPLLGWRISEAIDSEWATMLEASARRQWLIDSVKTDLIHTFLVCMRAFILEYELTAQLMEVDHHDACLTWLVTEPDVTQFKLCTEQAWRLAFKAGSEHLADHINTNAEHGHIPVKPFEVFVS
ncbi:MAG: hypothetical protein AAGA75_23850 [Cyanobacteria bacterium P01_E01_bin.6]